MRLDPFEQCTLEVQMKFRAFLFAFTGFALIPSGSSSAAPLVYGNYYDETAQVTCSSNSFCRLNFSQSPTDKLVMIRKLNCAVNSTNSLAEGYLYISTTNGGPQIQRNLPLPIPPAPLIGGTYWTNLESDIIG
jgi:hypothetical protein